MTSETKTERYVPAAIEPKWQEHWAATGLYDTADDSDKPNYYLVTRFPYPAGDMPIGPWYAMAPSDCEARFIRMQGHNVLFPMGFDAFGINAENAAIDRNMHPAIWTEKTKDQKREQ